MNPARKHARDDNCHKKPDDGSDKKHLELNPNNADVWTDMGVMYRRKGRPDGALRAFNKAIEINPHHQQSRFNKGIVLMHDLKNPEAGVRAWQELVSIYPDAKTQDQWTQVFDAKSFDEFGCQEEWTNLSDKDLSHIYTYLHAHAADSPTPL